MCRTKPMSVNTMETSIWMDEERNERESERILCVVTRASYVDLARLLDGGGEQRQCVSGVEEANYVFLH